MPRSDAYCAWAFLLLALLTLAHPATNAPVELQHGPALQPHKDEAVVRFHPWIIAGVAACSIVLAVLILAMCGGRSREKKQMRNAAQAAAMGSFETEGPYAEHAVIQG
ncbi:uncharacterized protein LOC135823820 [Sycon ciliatum]|uniref:uncharacterized protein LOC135823820 n=1 Tax=Sycon ciliatum TaxID=27933 RepID=UPI0031F6B30C